MMTEWPEREVANCGFLTRVSRLNLSIASTTSDESMIDPSTIASGESGSMPVLTSLKPPPLASFSSTSLTAEEPMSRPTRFFVFLNSTLPLPKNLRRFRAFTLGYFG